MSNFEEVEDTGTLPIPKKPQNDDVVNADEYLPTNATDEEIKNICKSNMDFAIVLSMGNDIPKPLQKLSPEVSQFEPAADNVDHYLAGSGEEKEINFFGEDGKEDKNVNNEFKKQGETFILDSVRDMIENEKTQGSYIYQNPNPNAPHKNWYGAYSTDPKWHYAIGGYQLSSGATIEKKVSSGGTYYVINSQTYLHDRYNWDRGEIIEFPELAKIFKPKEPQAYVPDHPNHVNHGGTPKYLEQVGSNVIVADETLGSLSSDKCRKILNKQAKNYDITAKSAVKAILPKKITL